MNRLRSGLRNRLRSGLPNRKRNRKRNRVAVLAVACAVLVTGCGSASASNQAEPAGLGQDDDLGGTVTVLAAASLTESFSDLATDFEKRHPGVTVRTSFGASSTLAQQILKGAPADVFASASTVNMKQVADAGRAPDPSVFARNVMEVAVPASNPAQIHSLSDLADPSVTLAICQPQVPCGHLAEQVFARAGLSVTPSTLEADVKATLTKVRLGEVDAGLVYATDVRSAPDAVRGIAIDPANNASTSYPIAALTDADNPRAAEAFVDFVRSGHGRDVLRSYGFEGP